MSGRQPGGSVAGPPLPSRPKLCDGLAIVPVEEGLLIEGGPERQLLTGRTAHRLPGLLQALDGCTGLAELAEKVQWPAAHVRGALEILQSCGLIEEGGIAPPGDAIDVYLSRSSAASGSVNRTEARQRLRDATVLLAGSDPLLQRLAGLLARSAVGRCQDVRGGLAAALACRQERDISLIVATDPEDAAIADAWSRRTGGAWLWFSSYCSQIGPLFQHGTTACWACAQRAGIGQPAEPLTADFSGRDSLLAGLAAGTAMHFLTRLGGPGEQRCVTILLDGCGSHSRRFIARDLDCQTCGLGCAGVAGSRIACAAIQYEQASESAPPELTAPRTASRMPFVQTNRNPWPTSPTIPLPPGLDALSSPAPGRPGSRTIGLDDIAILASTVAGLRDPEFPDAGRWAPTAGNLGSVQLYIGIAASSGLGPAVYYYDQPRHALATIAGQWGFEELAQCLPRKGGSPLAYVILTASMNRVIHKYQSYAYRLVHLDAGCAIAQCRLIAQALGYGITASSRWDDERLAALLCADRLREPVTGCLAVSATEEAA